MHDGMEIEFDPVILRADQMQPKQYYPVSYTHLTLPTILLV